MSYYGSMAHWNSGSTKHGSRVILLKSNEAMAYGANEVSNINL